MGTEAVFSPDTPGCPEHHRPPPSHPAGRLGAPSARGGRPARAGAAPALAGTQRAGDAGEPQPAGPAHPGELLPPLGVPQLTSGDGGCCRAGLGWGGGERDHAVAMLMPPNPVPVPLGGEHRGSMASPCAEEGQWGALPPLPAPARDAAPRPPPSPGPTRQVGAGHRGTPQPDRGARAAAVYALAGCSAVGQAVGLGTARGAAAAKSINKALCPTPRLRGQGRMPRSPQKRGQGIWWGGRRGLQLGHGVGARTPRHTARAVTPGVAGLQGPLRDGGTG